MIPQTIATWQTSTWKEELRDAITDVRGLLAMLALKESDFSTPILGASDFPLRVPASFIRRMQPGDPNDPLLLQVLPLAREQQKSNGFTTDPLQESSFNPTPGVIHKYHGRVLLVATPVCAVNCRYCFRRHFPYSENNPGKKHWLDSLDYVARDTSISEVILSGGDPLATDDQHLRWLAGEIGKIPHVKRLRIHTRFPVVIPGRIDDALLSWLNATRLETIFVLHINHPNEIDATLTEAVTKLRNINIPVLNQTVLLNNINDDAEILVALSEQLFSAGILPYYLHLLDPVEGAAHFDLSPSRACQLYDAIRSRLPGYLLPRLVRDVPGEPSKVAITPQNQDKTR